MLLRAIYYGLLRLHPRAFRERFGDEMANIFEEEARNGAASSLLFDALVSLIRQRAFRHAYPRPSVSLAGHVPIAAPRLFQILEIPPPSPSVLLNGGIFSLLFFAAVTFALGRMDGSNHRFLFGARYPASRILPVTPPATENEPTTEIKIAAPAADPLDPIAAAYFEKIRVLNALDADRDHLISPPEIANAPSALAKLDRNHDGELSAEECGFSPGTTDSRFAKKTTRSFMASHPVLSALDAERDGRISRSELGMSSLSLQSLDQNRDGALTLLEVLPKRY